MLGHKRGGFFVELGAGDGVDLSNTLALERHLDWGGICIEPSPQFQMLRRNRRCVCDPSCVGGGDGDVVTFLVDHKYGQHNHFSGIKELINCHQPQGLEYQMRTKTLASVLQQHNAPRVVSGDGNAKEIKKERKKMNIPRTHRCLLASFSPLDGLPFTGH